MQFDINEEFKNLNHRLTDIWNNMLKQSEFIKALQGKKIDKRLYLIYLFETYHYTAHNSRNQGLVGAMNHLNSTGYTKFCYHHAADEVGHELIALHDIYELGVKENSFTFPKPLADTEVLIAYLYWISIHGNPLQRLGYSYWAESCYSYIDPLINKVKQTLNLQDHQLKFFIAHSKIDEGHFQEVKDIITKHCRTKNDFEDIARVMETSFILTSRMVEAVYRAYLDLAMGKPSQYAFLSDYVEKESVVA